MIMDIGKTFNPKYKLHFGTHDGIHHVDELVGITILEIAYIKEEAYLVRTRKYDELNKLDIVIDVGEGKFDHHISGFNTCRETGEMYASAGLVWKCFAEKAISNIATEQGVYIHNDEIKIIKEQIDKEIIIPIDMEDNGKKVMKHKFSFIPKFRPTWLETPDYNIAFYKAEKIAFEIMKKIIKCKIEQIVTKKQLKRKHEYIITAVNAFEISKRIIKHKIAQIVAKKKLPKICDSVNNGIIEIPSQIFPWLEGVTRYNKNHNNSISFVIFPYPSGGWAAQCVPPSIKEEFEQLVPFPKEWAGENEKTLPKITGIKEATFCQNGRFFAKAKTKNAIIQMCKIAIIKAK